MNSLLFIANGDFYFPLNFISYLNEYFYIWSFNAGAINLDGILRILTKLPYILFFAISQSSLLTAYFYIFSITIISFVSFFYFIKYFLKSSSIYINVILAIFFAVNPIFLGNTAKIGLVLGVAMLPLILVFLKKYFESSKILYFIFTLIAMNVSLIHPFILIVNASIGGFYYGLQKYHYRNKRNFWKQILKEFIIFLGLNTFIFCALIPVGNLNKASILSDLNPDVSSINSLLNYANTNGLINSFAFSKDILKDFDFYNNSYKPIYFGTAFLLYSMIFIGCLLPKRKGNFDRWAFYWFFGFSLILQLFATGSLWGVDKFFTFLTQMPGGWAFRSPLKWQLYLPLFLFGAYGILIKSFRLKIQKIFVVLLLILFFSLNLYIGLDVYNKLLVPKKINTLSAFKSLSADNKTILFVGSENCTPIINELSEILISKNVQVKKIKQEKILNIYYPAFDYAISCRSLSISGFNFLSDVSFNGLFVYKNNDDKEQIFSFNTLYSLDSLNNIDAKHDFITNKLDNEFYFTNATRSEPTSPLVKVKSLFENIDFKNGVISDVVQNIKGNTELYFNINNSSLRNNLYLDNTKVSQGFILSDSNQNVFSYKNPKYSFNNLITNSSFETGFWLQKVGDCHNYDKNPILAMSLSKDKSDGEQSLQLEATRHTACSSIKLSLKEGSNYLLSFDYQSPNAKVASYYFGFNDKEKTVVKDTISITNKNWNTFSKTIKVPVGATSVSLYIYATATDGKTNIINRYDNFKLIEIPDLSAAYYLVSDPGVNLIEPKSVSFDLINPTKKLVHIKGATTPFFLAMSESYHSDWQLELNDAKVQGLLDSWWPFVKPNVVASEYHYQLNGFLNGWYVDPATLCTDTGASCAKNADGSYDIEMEIEFTPQRWFYLGLIISGATLFGCLSYLGYDFYKRRKLKKA